MPQHAPIRYLKYFSNYLFGSTIYLVKKCIDTHRHYSLFKGVRIRPIGRRKWFLCVFYHRFCPSHSGGLSDNNASRINYYYWKVMVVDKKCPYFNCWTQTHKQIRRKESIRTHSETRTYHIPPRSSKRIEDGASGWQSPIIVRQVLTTQSMDGQNCEYIRIWEQNEFHPEITAFTLFFSWFLSVVSVMHGRLHPILPNHACIMWTQIYRKMCAQQCRTVISWRNSSIVSPNILKRNFHDVAHIRSTAMVRWPASMRRAPNMQPNESSHQNQRKPFSGDYRSRGWEKAR